MADNVSVRDAANAAVTIATNEIATGIQAQAIQLLASDATGTDNRIPASTVTGLTVRPAGASTAVLANVAASATSVTVLAANANRLGAIIVNDSTASCYLKYGSTASTTSYTRLLPPGAEYELPGDVIYTGIITGIWTSATGTARTTELTA